MLRRRLNLALARKAAAKLIGADEESLENWEAGRRTNHIGFFAAILRFLGYDPLPKPTTRGQAARSALVRRGWGRKLLAQVAGRG